MNLSAYLSRIGFSEAPRPDLATLQALHRAHLLAIPYENLDVQFGRPLNTDPAAAYEKIVGRGRGGWCYEMNGLFGWALSEIGFKVTRLGGGGGDPGQVSVLGSHLVLRVDLDEPWIADVGFADGPIEPFAFSDGPFTQRGFEFGVESLSDGLWRLRNHQFGARPFYDCGPTDEAALAERCVWLQSDPQSGFVQNAVAFHHNAEGFCSLIGRVLRVITPAGAEKSLVVDADDYVRTLRERFDLDFPEAASLWPKIVARHEALFASPPATK